MQREITRELVRRLLPGAWRRATRGATAVCWPRRAAWPTAGRRRSAQRALCAAGPGWCIWPASSLLSSWCFPARRNAAPAAAGTAANGGIHPQDADALRRWFADRHTVLLAGPGLGESAADVCKALLGQERPVGRCRAGCRRTERTGSGEVQGGSARKHDPDAPPRARPRGCWA